MKVFDQKKSIETIIYLANRTDNPSRFDICRLMYLADKLSLEKYGRFIFGDGYLAIGLGPVPSRAYNLMEFANETAGYRFASDGYLIVTSRKAELDWLSKSDKECLDQIVNTYRNATKQKLLDDSCDSAWKSAWNARADRGWPLIITLESIIEMFENSDDLLDYMLCRDS